ncbi:toll/interleukin-1 receptor domain-containing protein [Natrarchaeobius oligotrophus]|uniref:Toll/interleukin-1 receptor domain-containing protein n=1 Tax=Natrarchaeobius chitinivorans TaxID=1679083 RepID=A0A3N6PFE9_NATCH|nr:toll/interleukin-1 receptor domain-containing protein [Natrarchaeobius chitinivorans]RQG96255.1 toll/interleukin-1 receptor domain-containing protein [Natrarchaeobius chitinivorans]
MTDEQIYVSHAPADLELVQELFSTVKNFPFGVHLALEEVDDNSERARLEGRLVDSDVVVAVLTNRSARSRWINQEIGYARAQGVPVVPLYDDETCRGGFVGETDGVSIARDDPSKTIFELLCDLRRELAPLGPLSVPNWFVEFPCTVSACPDRVVLEIEASQSKLWKRYRHGKPLAASCDECSSTYYFNPATIGFIRRENGTR